jgi:hypothetical protein
MKKLLAMLLAVAMLLCLAACGEEPTPTNPTESPKDTQPTVPSTPAATEPIDDGKLTYTVTITDENGKGLPGAVLQLCVETNCYPCVGSADGVATIDLEEAEYKVSFIAVPAGYVAEDAYYFESGATEMTIVLKAA